VATIADFWSEDPSDHPDLVVGLEAR
jgi:hypothetical protein